MPSQPEDSPLPPHLDPQAPRGLRRPPRAPSPQGRPDARPGGSTALPGPPRRRRSARILSFIAVGLSLAVFTASGAGYLLYRHYDSQIARIPVFGGLQGRPADGPRNAENVLLVGSDSRDGNGNTAFQGKGAEFVTGQRSDTVILAHLYGGSDKAQLVSFPRDSYATIPAHRDPTTGAPLPAAKGKLNSAISLGGPALLTATIEDLTDVRIDHYVQIDFEGFQAMVDKLGGVEVCLSQPAKEKDSGINLPAGRQTVRGDQALAFVRQRKELAGGDLDRIRRQQQFIGSIIRKVLSAGTLLNPIKLNGFLSVATSSLQVDEGLSPGDLKDLALRMRGFDAGGVLFSTVPVADSNKIINRESFVVLDDQKAAQLFQGLRSDTPPAAPAPAPAEPAAAEPLTVQPGAVRVMVYNAGGAAGLARRAAADLETGGFTVVGVPENRGTGATATVVRYGADKVAAARTLAAALPGATLELDRSLDRTLEAVVGSAYSGTVPVIVAGTSAPGPAPSTPGAGTSATSAAEDVCAP